MSGRRMGAPIKGAKEALTFFKARGDTVIVFSIWGDDKGRHTIAHWMHYYRIPYDEITNIKPAADWYIDDRAIHFTSWEELPIECGHAIQSPEITNT